MEDSPLKEFDKKEVEVLNRAFAAFNEATQQLQSSYDNLEARIKVLDLELARKNEELEQNLQEKEEVKNYLHNILESLTTGVVVVDANGIITTFNRTAETIFSLSAEHCMGKSLKAAFDTDLFENIISRSAQMPGASLSIDREIEIGKRKACWLRISASPVKTPNEESIGTVLILQDITHLRRLEEEAQRNQRLRATGEMAAGIAHEIRNPLASIELFASLLKQDLKEDDEKRALAERISSGVKNMDRIISSVLLFAQSAQPSRQKCDVDELIDGLLENSSELMIPENISVHKKLATAKILANGDDALLKQVFVNLLRNAIQAMPDGGTLSVETCIDAPASSDAQADPSGRRFVRISIADDGMGIPAEKRDNIFNPFFTTKDKGTGLGLSICHNIVKAHQGAIDLEATEGPGSTFIVKIPCWDAELDDQ
ncbi:MAG: PAS domain-containing protein [Candidatus Nitrohelix vancouverensis]|uniref:histidine kinase n=1 Tax=Candidatus Nitrohelix vancouverensis TaxID=2705534 RepID=A0A7T0C262_9BACT|nr:MAG: PAS domain-containing protein [Candidatus Nitrohelix vancouverensis]